MEVQNNGVPQQTGSTPQRRPQQMVRNGRPPQRPPQAGQRPVRPVGGAPRPVQRAVPRPNMTPQPSSNQAVQGEGVQTQRPEVPTKEPIQEPVVQEPITSEPIHGVQSPQPTQEVAQTPAPDLSNLSIKEQKKAMKEAEKQRKLAEKAAKKAAIAAKDGSKTAKKKKAPTDTKTTSKEPKSSGKLGSKIKDLVAKFKSLKKPVKFAISAGIVLVLILLMVLIKNVGGGKTTYYALIDQIFSARMGSFDYTISVTTAENGVEAQAVEVTEDTGVEEASDGEVDAEATDEASSEPTEASITDSTSEEVQQRTLTAVQSEWGTAEAESNFDSKYPNYTIKISGCTTSLDPVESSFSVILATKDFSDEFTDVVIKDDKYYINTEQMSYWLSQSGDTYFKQLATTLPTGSKYLILSKDDFVLHSPYAEESEKELATIGSISDGYTQFLALERMLLGAIHSANGKKGLGVKDGIYTLELGNNELYGVMKNTTTNSGVLFTSLIDGFYSAQMFDENRYVQATREKDNFIEAMLGMTRYFNTVSSDAANMYMTGQARQYTNGYGNAEIEGNMVFGWSDNEKTTKVAMNLLRSGDPKDVVVPTENTGSSTTEMLGVVEDSIYNLCECLNIFDFDIAKQLDVTPASIRTSTLEEFAKLVNDSGYAPYYLNSSNVLTFIQTYSNLEEDEYTSSNDKVCAKMVNDFTTELSDLIGGTVLVVEQEPEEEVEQHPVVKANIDGLDCEFVYNEEASSMGLYVVDALILNTNDMELPLAYTDFNLQSIMSSRYSANNFTMLHDLDNSVKKEDVETETVIAPTAYVKTQLKFAIPDSDIGYLNLFFGDRELGVIQVY